MAAKTDPRRLALLLVLLAAAAVFGLTRWRPTLLGGAGSGGALPPVKSYTVPDLGWSRLGGRELPTPGTVRNLFTYGPPPTPTPDRRPTPTPLPTRPPVPVVPRPTPTPGPPPPPAFTLTYIGWLGPSRLPVAVFRDGEEIVAAARGDTLKNKFIIREVKATGVTVGYVGFADTVNTEVPLAR
ncbi:MAG TPA: hypothetical protein P5234_07565 [Thermoanaerobaculaceae bacterium]|nr:hypothetical protein [Thermoanaerobaculaceae bacterium]HRS16096.1 hypothetical protein [Thermoanaerobaculaceae bacterium]